MTLRPWLLPNGRRPLLKDGSPRRSIVLSLAALQLLITAGSARATLYHQSRVQTSLGITNNATLEYETMFEDTLWQPGDVGSHLSFPTLQGSPTSYGSVSFHDGRLHMLAAAIPLYGEGFDYYATAATYASHQWRDIIRVSGGTIDPYLAVRFGMEGDWSVGGAWDGLNFALAPAAFVDEYGFGLYPDAWFYPPGGVGFDQSSFSAVGSWDYETQTLLANTLLLDDGYTYEETAVLPYGSVAWERTWLIPYSDTYGGYVFNFLFWGDATAGRGPVFNDFSHTVTLTAVTRQDGSEIEGPITFDSGFQFPATAVPEPSSLDTMGIGGLILGFLAVRQRSRA